MSLRVESEPALSDRDRDGAAFAAEDAVRLGALDCECGECPACLPELYDTTSPPEAHG